MSNRNLKFTKSLVESGFFKPQPLVIMDVGARGGFESFWSDLYADQVQFIGFDPDTEECDKLSRDLDKNTRIYPVALHRDKTTKIFYQTSLPDASSFYQPNEAVVNRFLDHINLKVVKTEEMPTQDADSFGREHGIEQIDFIKLDIEGAELDFLEGAEHLLGSTVLGMRLEVLFIDMRKGQPLFSEIEIFLRKKGFALFDLSPYRRSRKALPDRLAPTFMSACGQTIWAEALFLRDPVAELQGGSDHAINWDKFNIVKMASIMNVFGLNDCSVEVLQAATDKGILAKNWTDGLINQLIPEIKGVNTYSDYFQHLIRKDMQCFLQTVVNTRPDLRPAVERVVQYFNRGDVPLASQTLQDDLAPLMEYRDGVAPSMYELLKYFYETFCENAGEMVHRK